LDFPEGRPPFGPSFLWRETSLRKVRLTHH
jgi:hypothetical protein